MAHLSFEIIDGLSHRPGHVSGYYRIIVDSSTIKYLSFPAIPAAGPDIRGNRLAFSTVPEGEWNVGYLIQDPDDKKFRLQSTGTIELVGIRKRWHPSSIDWHDLSESVEGPAD